MAGVGKMKIWRLLTLTMSVPLLAQFAPLAAQKAALVVQDEEAMRSMTVLIKANAMAEGSKANPTYGHGAGIVIAVKDDRTYIVTACHVVDELLDDRSRLVAEFYDHKTFDADIWPGTYRKGCKEGPEEDDWSVLSVKTKPSLKLPFDKIGHAKPYDDVYVVGHPKGDLWQISGRPGIVTSREGSIIRFDSVAVLDGNSGGPVLANNLRLLVGMQIRAENGQVSHALDISYLRDRLQSPQWQIPCNLGPVLPRNPLTDLK
jgi:hypothetical protein